MDPLNVRRSLSVDETSISGDVPLLVHDSRPTAWRQWSQSSGIEVPRDASIIRLDSMIAIARAAERGLGAALVPVQLSEIELWPDGKSVKKAVVSFMVTLQPDQTGVWKLTGGAQPPGHELAVLVVVAETLVEPPRAGARGNYAPP
mgnify:CR=1 FL=1